MKTDKFRILYISHLHPPKNQPLKSVGGMQNVSVQMIEAVKRRKDVELQTIILHSSWKFIGIKTFFFQISLLWRIPLGIRRFKPDLILFSSMVTAGVLPFFIRKLPVPCATINHGQDVTLPNFVYQWYVPHIFKKLKGVISVSTATREASVRRGMDPDIGVALPNGYNLDAIEQLPSKKEAVEILEAALDISFGNSKILLTVGRQVKRKGHEWFIREVYGKIKSDIVYLIVGDGPEFDKIAAARESADRKDKIIMTGKLPRDLLNACYAASDLFVMPNIPIHGDMEGFGVVILEANSAGVPAIASDLEGIRDVIKQGVNGFRIPHGDAALFAGKIDEVMHHGLDELSFTSKDYVMNTFNWDTVIERYIKFLKSVNAE